MLTKKQQTKLYNELQDIFLSQQQVGKTLWDKTNNVLPISLRTELLQLQSLMYNNWHLMSELFNSVLTK